MFNDRKESAVLIKTPPITTIPLKNTGKDAAFPKLINQNLTQLLKSNKPLTPDEIALLTDYCQADAYPEHPTVPPEKSPLQLAIDQQNFAVLKIFIEKCKNPLSLAGLAQAITCLVQETAVNLKFLIHFERHPDKTKEAITLKRTLTNQIFNNLLHNTHTSLELSTLKNYLLAYKNLIPFYSEKRSGWRNTTNVDSTHWKTLMQQIKARLDQAQGLRFINEQTKAAKHATNTDEKTAYKSNPASYGYGRLTP